MKERDERIIEAAMGRFVRYGVKRTSMNDIAAEAGVSRQTLYNAFANKEALLKATIRLLADRVITGIEADLKTAEGLGNQLDVVFHHITVRHFDVLQASPNAEELVVGVNASCQEELETGAQRNIELMARMFAPHSSTLEKKGLTTRQLADFVQCSATAIKHGAKNRAHLLELLRTLRESVLGLAGQA